MIDTGTAAVGGEWRPYLESLECSQIINTHHHEDHIGNNLLFQEKFRAPVYAHERALPYLESPEKIGMQLYRRVVWKKPLPSQGFSIGAIVDTGKYKLHVIHTPGHCPDHICLYEPENGWLFSGDIFCGRRFDYLRKDEDFNLILESLKVLAALDVGTIFCGFKGIVEDVGDALVAKIRFMEKLRDRVLDLYGKGMAKAEIKRKLLGRETAMCLITLGHYSKQNTVDDIIRKESPSSGQLIGTL